MAARGNLLRSLQDLDAAGSNERKMARLKRQQRHSAEILQTFLAYRLVDAAEKMELGIAIGDPLLLRHEPDNQWDPNAVKVFWQATQRLSGSNMPPNGIWKSAIESCPLWCFRYIF